MQETCPFERPMTLERCRDYEAEIVDNVFFSEVDWANEYQESDIVLEDVSMSLEQLEELPMEDLFDLITQIDTLNPSLNTNLIDKFPPESRHKEQSIEPHQLNEEHEQPELDVPEDGKLSESLQSEHQRELMLQSTEDILLQPESVNATTVDESRLHPEATHVPPKSKRGRGRPSKQKSCPENFINGSRKDSEQREKPQKRRRGRPPLDKTKSAGVELVQSTSTYNQDRSKDRGRRTSAITPENTFRLNIRDLIY